MTLLRSVRRPGFAGAVSAISAIAAFVLLWVLKFQTFNGKFDYALTFIAVIWALIALWLGRDYRRRARELRKSGLT